jgi:hypothetical protein
LSAPAVKNLAGQRRLEETLLSLATLINLVVAASSGPFPYHDATNHLARYVLMERAWFGQPAPWTLVRLVPTPYIAVDLLGVALVHLLGPEAALRTLALIPLILLPSGMYMLLRATAPAQRGWALVGALFSFSWWYLEGSLSFTIGLGLMCFALALWWPNRRTRRWDIRLLITLSGMGLLFVHLFAALTLLVVVWLDWMLDVLMRWRAGRRPLRLLGPQALVALVLTGGCAAVYLWMRFTAGEATVVSPSFEWRPLSDKLLMLGSPFFAFTLFEFAVAFSGYAIGAMALAAQNWRQCRVNPFLIGGVAFLLLYAMSPGTWNIDVRWLPAAYLLPFCMPTRARPPARNLMLVLFGFCVAHALIVAGYANVIRRQLHDFDVALGRLPPTARLLPLVSDHHQFRVRPYFHYALWHTIRTSSRVGGLFSREGTREGDPTYTHLDYFDVRSSLYFPLAAWGVESFEPLDCERVRRDYDYILQAGLDAKAGRAIERCGSVAFTVGDFRVYRVNPAIPSPS